MGQCNAGPETKLTPRNAGKNWGFFGFYYTLALPVRNKWTLLPLVKRVPVLQPTLKTGNGCPMSGANYNSPRRLGVESLEGRQLMAGNVLASVNAAHDLVVTSDGNQHDLEIVQVTQNGQPVAGRYFIAPHQGTTLNGQTSGQFFNNVTHDVRVTLGGSGDRLNLHAENGNDFGFQVPNDLTINMGGGNNVLNIDHVSVGDDVTVFSGGGADSVFFRGRVGLSGNLIDKGANDLTIDTGNRNDNVKLQNFAVRRDVNIRVGGTDNFTDSVDLLFASIGRNTRVDTGAGGDLVNINEVGFNGVATINTGGGTTPANDADSVSVTESQADQFFFNLGIGDDTMTMFDSFGRRATLNGGTNPRDNDRLTENSSHNFTDPSQPLIVNFEHHNN